MDPLTESLITLDQLVEDDVEPVNVRVVEHFLLRTGRPLPRVIILGEGLAQICRQVDASGGDSMGVAGPNRIAQARAQYPGGSFLEADFRAMPVERSAWDGAWIGRMVEHIPRANLAAALASVHAALRPGGLLHVMLVPGGEEGFRETPHGRIYRACWVEADFVQAIGALDFSLLERSASASETALIFRREY